MTGLEAELEQARLLIKEQREDLHVAAERIIALTKERNELHAELSRAYARAADLAKEALR